MAEETKIEWCDHSWSPWHGCTRVSEGCRHCYAEQWAYRFKRVAWGGVPVRSSQAGWWNPVKWHAEADKLGRYATIFPSLCDPFDNQVDDDLRQKFWRLIQSTPRLLWLLLTKRPQNIARQLPESWGAGWHNVAIGITAENQEELDRRASVVLRIPARLHFVSCEPLLGPLDFNALSDGVENLNALTGLRENGFGDIVTRHRGSRIGWVIAGAESGNGARPMDDSWVRNIRDQCRDARVPFFYKQKIVSGRKVSLPLIDDRQHAEKPIWMS